MRNGSSLYLYPRTQDLYKKNPGLVAKLVHVGVDWLKGTCRKYMRETPWEQTLVVQVRVIGDSAPPIPIAEFFTVITTKLQQMNKSAAGPDGRDVCHPATQVVLRLLFILHMVGRQPSSWGMNRTTLLPKDCKDLYLVTNFSPITICSILSQVLGELLIQRSAKWSCSQPDRMASKASLMSSMTATRAGCLYFSVEARLRSAHY